VAAGSIDSYGGAVAYASDGSYCYKVVIGDGVAYGGGEIIQNTGASSGCESVDYTVGGTNVYAIGYYASTSGDDQNYDDGDYCSAISGSRTALLSLVVDDSATEQTLVSAEPSTCYYTFELTASSASLVVPPTPAPTPAPTPVPTPAPVAAGSIDSYGRVRPENPRNPREGKGEGPPNSQNPWLGCGCGYRRKATGSRDAPYPRGCPAPGRPPDFCSRACNAAARLSGRSKSSLICASESKFGGFHIFFIKLEDFW
jgi:hypothetical protein